MTVVVMVVNNDLSLLNQFINRNMAFGIADRWDRLRHRRHEGPADGCYTHGSNGGTRQDISEQGTTTNFSHAYAPWFNTQKRGVQKPRQESGRQAGSLRLHKLSPFQKRAHQSALAS
jgi:hypothetical protein